MAARDGMNTFPLAADMKALREPELPSSGSKSKIKTESTPKSCSLHSKGDRSFGAALKTTSLIKRSCVPTMAGSPRSTVRLLRTGLSGSASCH